MTLRKNPQKYVTFELNNKLFPEATGFYELLPYYQKLKVLDTEKTDFAIQYSPYEKQWQLIKNPFGDPFSQNLDPTTVATLLIDEKISEPCDIKAYATLQNLKSKVEKRGVQNKDLKIKVAKMENEIHDLKIQNQNFKFQIEKNEGFEKKLIKSVETNKKLRNHILEQNEIGEKEKKEQKIEFENSMEEIKILKSNLEEKEILIKKQISQIKSLELTKGDLSYKLELTKEFEKKI